uniref:Uncharacterized protein n=1 Tax=viral metagenome TaxID=1070528 RepID=A0A6C0EFY4_9ZZZZ
MKNQLHIESTGKNAIYVNGKPISHAEYYLEIPGTDNAKLDVKVDGEQYAIRDFTIRDLEKMLRMPVQHKPTPFARTIFDESNKYIDVPKSSSKRRSRASSRSRSKSPKRSSSRKKTTRKRSSKKRSRNSSKRSSKGKKSSRKLTIY